jgi:cytochrome c oxidase accessory protein FixG
MSNELKTYSSSRPESPRNATSPRKDLKRPSLSAVTTINDDGSRRFLFPADAKGQFTLWRRISGYALIAIYLALPWIPVGGHPAVFLDIGSGRFHFFGHTLASQDLWLLFFGVSGLGFLLFFATALFGRVWCGWACPQTVFLDHVYRVVERLIDGDAPTRRALAAAPLTAAKTFRRVTKHGVYALISLAIAHLFLAYFVSITELWVMIQEAPAEHWAAFLFVFVTAGLLYFNFAWFREQLCIVICPYGRLQSALTDDHSLVIGYDRTRGEPRGKLSLPGAGACIDCNRCVQVCPTGIDIRHGLQLECIGCAACIDACDEIMTKVNRPTGLIRYDSFSAFKGSRTRWIRPRTIVYSLLLLTGVGAAGWGVTTVHPASMTVVRMTGSAYFVGKDSVRNQFLVRVVNRRHESAAYPVSLIDVPASARVEGVDGTVTVAALGEQVTPLVVNVDRRDYRGPFKFTLALRNAAGEVMQSREVEFLGPDAHLLREEDAENGIHR